MTRVVRRGHRSTWEAPPLVEEPDEAHKVKKFRRAWAMAEELGMTDKERYSLAQMLPGVDKDSGGSWKPLNDKQLHDLLTMMDGYVWLTHLFSQRLDTDHDEE